MAGYKQLCWTCQNACSSCDCIWVETLDISKCSSLKLKFDNEGYISSCKNYKKEKPYYSSMKLKAKMLGVSYDYYIKLVKEIKKYNLDISPEDLHSLKQEQKQDFENEKDEALRLGISLKRFYDIRRYITKNCLNMSVAEYLTKQQENKKQVQKEKEIKNEKTLKRKLKKGAITQNARLLGVSTTAYYNLLYEIETKKLNITPEELHRQKQVRKQERLTNTKQARAKALGISYDQFYRYEKEIKNLSLNITVEQFLENKKYYRQLKRVS